MLKGRLVIRNVTVNGLRTSVRLERVSLSALDQISKVEDISVHQLCTMIDAARNAGSSRTSTIRAFIVSYFREAANGRAMVQGMAGALLGEDA